MLCRFSVLSVMILAGLICAGSLYAAEQVPVLPGKVVQESVQQDGIGRTYLTYVPSGELSSPAIFIALHGARGSGSQMREASAYQFDRLAEKVKCIVIYPDGYMNHWNDCRTTPTDEAHAKNINDVAFIGKVIEAGCTKWHADPKKVYAVGLSNGGHLCFRLAVEIPERISGIAVIGANMPSPEYSKCAYPRPGMPVMIINGTDDPINPFEGGMVRLFYVISRGEVVSSKQTARLWLRPEDRGKFPEMAKYKDLDQGDETYIETLTWPDSRVRLYTVYGGGHTIPGGEQYLPQFVVGRVNRDMNTAEEAWRFFQEKGK